MWMGDSLQPDAAGISITIDGPIATLLLDRPDSYNAQTPHMWHVMAGLCEALPAEVRVVVVRGAGRAFSAGLDRSVMTASAGRPSELHRIGALSEADAEETIAGFQRAFGWLSRPDVVSIAAVQGHAVGAGLQLALACDLRVLADDAQLTMAEVPLGLVPDLGGTKRLVELCGYSRALDICLTGRRVDAADADRIGLATRVVAVDQLDAAVRELCATVLRAPAGAVRAVKELLLGAADRDQAAQERAERRAQVQRLRELSATD